MCLSTASWGVAFETVGLIKYWKGFGLEQLLQFRRFWRRSLKYRTREKSGGKLQQLIIVGTAGRDAIPPSSELSDGGCGSRMEDPEDDAVETTSQLLLL